MPLEALSTKPPAAPKRCYIKRVVREGQPTHPTNVQPTQTKMTVDFSKDVMIGMLREGDTGNQILDILNVIAPEIDSTESEDIAAKATLDPIDF